ncbi:hypothetical protein Kpol_1019p23 [Vanderwaltozyma polyspora DSM 70294]|uniref:BPL/LPL catalytic domain-containing protein n=1 Tax=Vanderwaltozyma polyspora (strain ATCC 22028 / DSM 70294 / BCRC 21397 / CBS 2163 / NBRC 10782 / NRRL Y-8283 / UCD 57-17) TaxID=436907 RepID=A7TPB6_VANPO|nr:uncharacterized protein Kpol_1019p23 [Vanderwaltozyma polyspora DSM 70294]EDO15903.1 hypothetical protein Kpol_1019p23 [Vanderwaltozyma polyspora DSM 70294]
MNVLVFNGTGASASSVKHTVETLRRFLEPYYAVNTVSIKALESEPWTFKASAIVFPGGADLPYVKNCKNVIPKIRNFIESGGIYIGFCAGGYFGSSRCEFSQGDPLLEITGNRELALFPGIARGPAFKGFQYNSELGTKAATLKLKDGSAFKSYFNGGPTFVDAENYNNVEVLAYFQEPTDVSSSDINSTNDLNEGNTVNAAAVVLCEVGKGKALLTGPHPEFNPEYLEKSESREFIKDVIKELKDNEKERLKFMKFILTSAGLKCSDHDETQPLPTLKPLFASSSSNRHHYLTRFKEALIEHGSEDTKIYPQSGIEFDGGENKIMIFEGFNKNYRHLSDLMSKYDLDDELIQSIIFPDQGENFPPKSYTPHFNTEIYFENLKTNSVGSICLYGEVVTSTSTLLNANRLLLSNIPNNSLLHVGTIQLSGRGRGGNSWVNPVGVCASTAVINIPTVSRFTNKPISVVFVQYLAILAYCKAIISYDSGFEDIPIKIKWPNDIYILSPNYYSQKKMHILGRGMESRVVPLTEIEPAYVKVAGMLVNTNYINNGYSVLLGCGLNINTEGPTTSLMRWVNLLNEERKAQNLAPLPEIKTEKLLALYMNHLEVLLETYERYGSSAILEDYYKFWLHTNQLVTLSDHQNVKAIISGITSDYGLLIAKECVQGSETEFTSTVYNLQPDGNSFDIFKGLISKKVL